MRTAPLVLFFAFLAVMGGCAKEENTLQPRGSGSLSGKVTDGSSNALSGVAVDTLPATTTQTTDASGNYSFSGIGVANYTVTAKKSGFVKASVAATVENGKTTTVNISVSAGPSYASAIQPIFNANCTASGCHSASAPGGNYSLTTYAGTTAKDVIAFDGDGSLLYKRIAGTSAGAQMPSGSLPLSASDQQKIKDWINSGIPNN